VSTRTGLPKSSSIQHVWSLGSIALSQSARAVCWLRVPHPIQRLLCLLPRSRRPAAPHHTRALGIQCEGGACGRIGRSEYLFAGPHLRRPMVGGKHQDRRRRKLYTPEKFMSGVPADHTHSPWNPQPEPGVRYVPCCPRTPRCAPSLSTLQPCRGSSSSHRCSAAVRAPVTLGSRAAARAATACGGQRLQRRGIPLAPARRLLQHRN
jgi:hypothetical protein